VYLDQRGRAVPATGVVGFSNRILDGTKHRSSSFAQKVADAGPGNSGVRCEADWGRAIRDVGVFEATRRPRAPRSRPDLG
jgi:hypothetical protein